MAEKKISQKQFKQALKLNIFGGSTFTIWFSVCAAQPLFNVFFTNHLGATSSQLGIIIGIIQLATVFNLLGILVYGKLKTRKKYYVIMHIIHRSLGIVMAIGCFYVARTGNNQAVIKMAFLAYGISWILGYSSSAGWWSWMADLIPENIRAREFGKRSAIMNIVGIIWFLSSTILLDAFTNVNIFIIYGIIFSFAALVGIADPISTIFIPEPSEHEKEKITFTHFIEPLKNMNFIIFSVGVGVAIFAINVFTPFTSPYITSKSEIAAPNTWLGIMFVISQTTWILVSPSWGLIMDKFGRKPVLMIGYLSILPNLYFLILTPNNYFIILPLLALSGGLLAPALWDGVNQMMLSLTPTKNRTAFVSWYMTIVGLVSSGGAVVGGVLKDKTQNINLQLFGYFQVKSIHIILMLSIILILLGLLIISRVKEDKSRPLKFVVSRVARPGVFRSFSNMGTLSGTYNSNKVEKVLRALERDSDDLALDDIIERLSDPESDVREEAARALGRIKSLDAIEPLIQELNDINSTIRTQAALSLGKIGDTRALPSLFEALESQSEDVQNAAVKALGMLGSDESIKNLLKLFHNKSERLTATGAIAISQLGALEAAWDIIPKMHTSKNPVLIKQLSIAIGNLLGTPGEFYRYITGKDNSRSNYLENLFDDVVKNSDKIIRLCSDHKLSTESKKILGLQFKEIKHLYEEVKYREAFTILSNCVRIIIKTIFPQEKNLDESLYLEHLFPINQKVGIWWWFVSQAEEYLDTSTEQIIKKDVLIVLYFISTFKGTSSKSKQQNS